ncbi:hypothetical protein EJ03DRAFT_323493 [Teratosphaeria nubilosa]|uniref:Uncharacterized protein n=1 Tax=Teratosphaeria nubilosa TaxID=161662 RepID=A0A6G1LLP5_9PEZI|nr:hypothetical protein EJ03DRAFT_323493 [Teratosphaeria nubilosa]
MRIRTPRPPRVQTSPQQDLLHALPKAPRHPKHRPIIPTHNPPQGSLRNVTPLHLVPTPPPLENSLRHILRHSTQHNTPTLSPTTQTPDKNPHRCIQRHAGPCRQFLEPPTRPML